MTIYEIAREAGVSASSVSRVINNKPGVNKQMREKIQQLLEKYHYVPNEAARGLVTSNSKLVGILIADIRAQHHIRGAYHIANELARHNYFCMILNTGNSDEERTACIQLLRQRQAEAAVLMGSTFRTTAVQVAIEQFLPDTPIFMMNGFIALPNVYGVLSDERWGIADCVAMLGRKGKRSIAFFVDQPTPSSALKTEGFIRGMAALGREESGLWIYRDVEGSQNGGYETAKRLLAEHPEVDGLICSQDIIACGAMRAIQNSGRSIPADVAVIGVDLSLIHISEPTRLL